MIRYRSFENRDPPALAEIWRTHAPLRGLVQAVTPPMLEKYIFAKPWFDRHGLIVACEGARPIGFVHASFGANKDQSDIDTHQGTICLLHVAPHEQRSQIAMELLSSAEDYLRRGGAQQIYAGAQFPLNAFYLGFYGSSDVPGVLKSDAQFVELLEASGYRPTISRALWRRSLAGFRTPVDRQWMQVRRRFVLTAASDSVPDNWWEACVWSHHDWTRYNLTLAGGGEPLISATFWDVEPLGRSWGAQTLGLVRIEDTPEARGEGLTAFLLGEVLRQAETEGYAQFEAQAPATDNSLAEVFTRLGLSQYDEGSLWVKG